jgi:hypothetical protein
VDKGNLKIFFVEGVKPHLQSDVRLHVKPVMTFEEVKHVGQTVGDYKHHTLAMLPFRGRAYKLDLLSHMHLHPTFYVSLIDPFVHDTQSSRLRPTPMPDLFADWHEEWKVSAIVSHRWRASTCSI